MDKAVDSITKEVAETHAAVARHICHIPDSEPIIILRIRGQRTLDCGRACEGCPRYSECFPSTNPQQQAMWERFLGQLFEGGGR